MRHRSTKIALSRKTGPRRALLRNLVASFVMHGSLTTTPAKARLVRSKTERLITYGRQNTLTRRRRLLSFFFTAQPVHQILTVLSPKYQTRAGGYTRMTKIGKRKGDGAEQVKIEFV